MKLGCKSVAELLLSMHQALRGSPTLHAQYHRHTQTNKHGHKRKARMRQRQEELFKSEATLVYRESSRAARAPQRVCLKHKTNRKTNTTGCLDREQCRRCGCGQGCHLDELVQWAVESLKRKGTFEQSLREQ